MRVIVAALAILSLAACAAATLFPEQDAAPSRSTSTVTRPDTTLIQDKITACVEPQLPPAFHVDAEVMSIGWKFDIKDTTGKKTYGSVTESMLSYAQTFTWAWRGEVQSVAERAPISFGVEITVNDCNKKKLAMLEEQIFSTIGSLSNRYTIKDNAGKVVGETDKFEWFSGTTFTIKSAAAGNKVLAKVKRPVFTWGDQWQITRIGTATTPADKLAADPRVLVMMAALKSASKSSGTRGLIWFFIYLAVIIVFCLVCFGAFVMVRVLRDGADFDAELVPCGRCCPSWVIGNHRNDGPAYAYVDDWHPDRHAYA